MLPPPLQKIIHTPIRFLHVSLNSAQKALTDKLQRVINAAERVISDTSKYDRGLTTLQRDEFHWLDVRDGVTFKLVVMVHQCLNRQVPQYLAVHCVPLSSQRHICFTEQNNVPLNWARLVTWISLLLVQLLVHNPNATEAAFKQLLQTFLFARC